LPFAAELLPATMTPEPQPLAAASDKDERGQTAWGWLTQAWQDLRYAFRQLLKAPGFATTVVTTLALGIGACTVVFTAINTTLLHPSDAPDPERNVLIHETQLPFEKP
jgi:hypothetical protein